MATFDGAGFAERGRGGGSFFPIHPRRVAVAILKIPGGNKTVIQTLGQPAAPFDMPARVTAAQLSALQGKVGGSGTLAYSFASITATLEAIDERTEVRKDADHVFIILKFLVTSF